MENGFVGIEEKLEDKWVLWILKVLLLLSLNKQADHLEKKYAFLQCMNIPRPSDGTNKEFDCVCLEWTSTDEIDYNKRGDCNRESSIGEWFELKLLATVSGVVYVARSKFGMKPFCNDSA